MATGPGLSSISKVQRAGEAGPLLLLLREAPSGAGLGGALVMPARAGGKPA